MINLNQTQSLHPKAKNLWFLQGTVGALLLCGIFIFPAIHFYGQVTVSVAQNFGFIIPLFIFAALEIISIGMVQLRYNNFSYILKDEGIMIAQGIITKQSHLIPYNKIQNVNGRRGIFARMLGLTELEIETAAQNIDISTHTTMVGDRPHTTTTARSRPEGVLPGLEAAVADELMAYLLARNK